MFVIGSHIGFVLVFEDEGLEDLSQVIGHLRGMWEHIRANDVPPPHLYGVFAEGTNQELVDQFMASLKDQKDGQSSDLIIIREGESDDE